MTAARHSRRKTSAFCEFLSKPLIINVLKNKAICLHKPFIHGTFVRYFGVLALYFTGDGKIKPLLMEFIGF
jgi:hypothetical protein